MLDSKQYKMLKKINRVKEFDYTDLEEELKEIIHYLASSGFLLYISNDKKENRKLCKIKQEGKSEIYSYKVEHFHFWFTSIIALFALFISVLSLATTNPVVWKSILKAISSLF